LPGTERFAGIETLVLALPLAGVIGLLSSAVQNRPRSLLNAKPRAVWAVPFLSEALLVCAAALAYTAAPVGCVFPLGSGFGKWPRPLDFAAILLLWLPLEFGAGAGLVGWSCAWDSARSRA
jgi:hypothetical protein